ncbi:ribonuclease H-like domain-containing protein, partial [Tanacetum coccineum]
MNKKNHSTHKIYLFQEKIESVSAHVVAATKLLVLNPNEIELWKMRIEQYFLMIYYALWEVILNGDLLANKNLMVLRHQYSYTHRTEAARKNELKARGTLLMALLNEHQLKFNTYKSAKSLMEAIEKRIKKSASEVEKTRTLNLEEQTDLEELNMDLLSDVVIDSFFASQSSFTIRTLRPKAKGSGDLEEMDLSGRWQYCINASKRFLRRQKGIDEYEGFVVDWSDPAKDRTYHFALKAYTSSVIPSSAQVNDKYKIGEGYHAVSPPYTGNFMPYKHDFVLADKDGYVFSESVTSVPDIATSKAKTSESKPKFVSEPLIEDYISNSEDENETEPKSKQRKSSFAKVEFVKSNEHIKSHRESVKKGNPQLELQEKGVIDSRCSRHMTINMSYLSNYEEINGGYVAFGGDPKGGKITGKGEILQEVYLQRFLKMIIHVLLVQKERNIKPLVRPKLNRKSNNHGVKIIRCDNGTEFKNKEMNQFCKMKGIKREFSVARTLQQNRVAERKNRTLIEAARTMLVDSKLPTTFWAEAVNTTCYVQNRVLVIKPHNKIPYELFHGRTPSLSFMRPFGCPITILNTLDQLGKFNGKANEGFFVGYSMNSMAFRVFNSRTRIVEENLHITFFENKPNVEKSGPEWLFGINTLTKSMNYKRVVAGNQSNGSAGTKACDNAGKARVETIPGKDYILLPFLTQDPLFSSSSKDSPDVGFKPSREKEKKDAEALENEDSEVLNTEEPRVNQEQD